MSKIYMLCGLPGSGKSTWAKNNGGLIINRDSIRTMLNGEYIYDVKIEPVVKEIAQASVMSAMKYGFDIIIDETNLTVAKRSFWYQLCGPNTICVYFTENENNLRNRMNDPRGISEEKWDDIIEEMKACFETPTTEEGFEIICQK